MAVSSRARVTSDTGLTLTAYAGPRSVVLGFDIGAETGDDVALTGLAGFVLRRERLSGPRPQVVWLNDPRQNSAAGSGRAAANGRAAVAAAVDEEASTEEVSLERAVQRPIRDFKWGDYAVQPDCEYSYTLYKVLQGEGGCLEATSSQPAHFSASSPVREAQEKKPQKDKEEEQWQWLSRGLEEALVSFIELGGPGWQIYAALYEAHYLPIMQALQKAKEERSVAVRLIVDWKKPSWNNLKKEWTQRGPQHMNAWALEEAGLLPGYGASGPCCVSFRTRPLSAISHNKFFVLVDPSGKASAVWTGSTNMTSGAIFGHSNVGHVVRDPAVCSKFLEYWHELSKDPEKKDFAKFNEELSPLPEEGEEFSTIALFSPRLRWAATLDFFAQLALSAKQCVLFTAAFGISKEIAPALIGGDSNVLKYLLLEGEGQWPASKETVKTLRRRENVRCAFGTLVDEAPTGSRWMPETLTGLNAHVKFVHTKFLLVDPFSDAPVVISGSANFSKASMESNDENMLVVRGNKQLADAYAVEFFRMFEHFRFRNLMESSEKEREKEQEAAGEIAVLCKCGEAVREGITQKAGPNHGRPYRACARPRDKSCGFFKWMDTDLPSTRQVLPWPQCCYDAGSFQTLERRMIGSQYPTAAEDRHAASIAGDKATEEESPVAEQEEKEEEGLLVSMGVAVDDMLGALTSVFSKISIGDSQPPGEAARTEEVAAAATLLDLGAARDAARRLLVVDPRPKGGEQDYRAASEELQTRVKALPEAERAREPTLSLLGAMESSFVAQRLASWKPYVLRIIKLLGEEDCKVDELARNHRMHRQMVAMNA
eukprot:TRINITY_DN7933_c0_g1_i5.p1 TRINITY_DN7933_c0_g1~~TRINITY_DN7933_c0_g1_i5.p1  ORF type:complete len:851 (+),score=184.96 TRINITY_DN7933_c0_g1_i5:80-2554(+)